MYQVILSISESATKCLSGFFFRKSILDPRVYFWTLFQDIDQIFLKISKFCAINFLLSSDYQIFNITGPECVCRKSSNGNKETEASIGKNIYFWFRWGSSINESCGVVGVVEVEMWMCVCALQWS